MGVASPGLDDGKFEERIQAIHVELAGLNEEANLLAAIIQANFRELVI